MCYQKLCQFSQQYCALTMTLQEQKQQHAATKRQRHQTPELRQRHQTPGYHNKWGAQQWNHGTSYCRNAVDKKKVK